MFYCKPCRRTNNWPGVVPTSYGPCEVCKVEGPCYDFPTYMLTEGKEFDWPGLYSTREEIDRLEERLEQLYAKRRQMIKEMRQDGMKQREIGAYWGISNPRVSSILLQIRDDK